MRPAELIFWTSAGVVAWVYVGYPAVAAIAGRFRPFEARLGPLERPLVTVGIAAHNEAANLEDRIANALGQAGQFEVEVIVALDGSTDGSVEIVERLAKAEPRVRSLVLERMGQTGAQAEIFGAARGQIVVLTDAETRFAPDCLAHLIAPLGDPLVGCSTGRLAWLDVDQTQTSRNEGAYWRYEQLVRRLESRAGWLTTATGALLAIRRDDYHAVPAHASMDHLLPLYARDAGLRVIAVGEAVATDRPISNMRTQLRNRTRTATRGIRANLSMVGRLTPWRRPSAFVAIWSHKLLRWATPILGIAALGAAASLATDGSPSYLVPILMALAVLGAGVLGLALRSRGWSSRWASLPIAILIVNVAFLQGWINVVLGRRIGAWSGMEWTAATAAHREDD